MRQQLVAQRERTVDESARVAAGDHDAGTVRRDGETLGADGGIDPQIDDGGQLGRTASTLRMASEKSRRRDAYAPAVFP